MKYIRTKEERIVDTETKYLNFVSKEEYLKQVKEDKKGLIVSHIEDNVWYCYCESDGCEWESDIIKQADTIEELCDEFLIRGTRGLYLGIPLQECELRNIPKTQIYGAIWTDKGLIYVAKMNEKGELELL